VAHAFHQLTEVGTCCRGEVVPSVPKSVEENAGQPAWLHARSQAGGQAQKARGEPCDLLLSGWVDRVADPLADLGFDQVG
jgi:hypothetical protein